MDEILADFGILGVGADGQTFVHEYGHHIGILVAGDREPADFEVLIALGNFRVHPGTDGQHRGLAREEQLQHLGVGDAVDVVSGVLGAQGLILLHALDQVRVVELHFVGIALRAPVGILGQQVGAGKHVSQLTLGPSVLQALSHGLDAGSQQLVAGRNQFVPGVRHFNAVGGAHVLVVEHADDLLLVVGYVLFSADLAHFGIRQVVQLAVVKGQQGAGGHEVSGVLHHHHVRELVGGQQGLFILGQRHVGGRVADDLNFHAGVRGHVAVGDGLPEFNRQLGLNVDAENDFLAFGAGSTECSA